MILVLNKDIYRDKGLPVSPGADGNSGALLYCLRQKTDSDAIYSARVKKLGEIYENIRLNSGSDFISIAHNKRLKLEEDVDYLAYNLMLIRDDIAMSQNEYVKSKHVGYIINEEKENKEIISKAERIEKALAYINQKANIDILPHIAMWCNIPAKGSSTILNGKVLAYAIENPDRVISFFENDEVTSIIWIQKLQQAGKIVRKSGTYMFGSHVIGNDMNQILLFINKPENAIIVESMNKEVPLEKYSFVEKEVNIEY